MQFEISTTDEPGQFDVTAKILGVKMEKFELIFQVIITNWLIKSSNYFHQRSKLEI